MDPQAWVWRSIGLVVVAVAVVIALWLMGQVGGAIGSIDLTTPTASVSATATATIAGPTIEPTTSDLLPSASPSGRRTPTPSPKH